MRASDDTRLAPYTMRSVGALLGVSRGIVNRLIAAKCVEPSRGPRNELRFTFQDVVLLRTAHGLQRSRLGSREVLQSLRSLRAQLPAEVPLSGLRIVAQGDTIAVRDGVAAWEPRSGQLLLDLEVSCADGQIAMLVHAAESLEDSGDDAGRTWFEKAITLEAADPTAAVEAYFRALACDPPCDGARFNLSALLCELGRYEVVLQVYAAASDSELEEPAIHFNAAIAMEELGRVPEAVATYQRCLQIAPDFADAHFNIARLYQQLNRPQETLRHFSAYRRLQKATDEEQ